MTMATVRPGTGSRTAERAGGGRELLLAVGVVPLLLALALIPLLTPAFTHPALEAAGSAAWLRLPGDETRALSDRSVTELVLGPGSFAFAGPNGRPFYDAAERAHLGEARLLLLGLFALAVVMTVVLVVALVRAPDAATRAARWRAVAAGGAATALVTVALAVVALVAFDALFTLFHQLAFPGGGWAFDPSRERLVQLYPYRFWEIASAGLAVLVIALGAATWWLGRHVARRADRRAPGAPR